MYVVKLVSFDLWDTLIFDEGVEPESYTLKRLEAIWKSIPSDKNQGLTMYSRHTGLLNMSRGLSSQRTSSRLSYLYSDLI